MPVINSALGLVGLATRGQLDRAVDRKDRWHGLVREVFGQYYLKFRESSLGNMPELPTRYSAEWENHIRAELDAFLSLDLESVGQLLEACGFGTQKWEKLQETGFPALRRLMDEVAETGELPDFGGNGHSALGDEVLTQAVDEDVLDLLQQHPDLAEEMVRRIDLDSGRLLLDKQDLEESEAFRQLQAHHEAALEELRRFRRGGRQALDRIRQLQGRIEDLQSQAVELDVSGSEADPDQDREIANLRKELRAREASSAALRGRVEALEAQLAEVADPDATLQEALAAAEEAMQERDDTIVRLQARIERLEAAQDDEAEDTESEELRELRSMLKSREHEIEGLRSELEESKSARPSLGDTGELEEQIGELQSQLRARDHSIESLRGELERLQSQETTGDRAHGSSDEEGEDPTQLRHLLAARDTTIAGLREELARLEAELEADTPHVAAQEEVGDLQQLRNDLRAREHTIETLEEQVAKLEADLERVERRGGGRSTDEEADTGAAGTGSGDTRLQEQVQSLQSDLAARDGTILDLRKQVHAFEEELGQARDQLLTEVEKLKALTSGDLELKPSAELDAMESDELLDYARDVAEDLDVRRQTLDEGLQGIESVKGSYEESKRVYQEQEESMQEQLETLRSELDTYQQQQARDAAAGTADSHDLIVKQREQLDLLSTRIRQLVASNQDLNESNKKMYENLEQAVKRVIPLRKQIEELDSLNEALQRYIRQTHDRTFTTRKLAEAGVAP